MNEALSQMDLTSSPGRIMGYLARHPQAPCCRDLEEHFHLSHPSVSGTLTRLEKKGFIACRPDPEDHRCKRIYLLPKGEQCHRQIISAIDRIEAQVTAGFTPEERAQFSDFLDRAIINLGGSVCMPPLEEEK